MMSIHVPHVRDLPKFLFVPWAEQLLHDGSQGVLTKRPLMACSRGAGLRLRGGNGEEDIFKEPPYKRGRVMRPRAGELAWEDIRQPAVAALEEAPGTAQKENKTQEFVREDNHWTAIHPSNDQPTRSTREITASHPMATREWEGPAAPAGVFVPGDARVEGGDGTSTGDMGSRKVGIWVPDLHDAAREGHADVIPTLAGIDFTGMTPPVCRCACVHAFSILDALWAYPCCSCQAAHGLIASVCQDSHCRPAHLKKSICIAALQQKWWISCATALLEVFDGCLYPRSQ